MAHIYQRSRSPFWWIRYRASNGKIVRESTGLRVGIGGHTLKARQLCAEHSLRESRIAVGMASEAWGEWVPDWFRLRYENPLSLLRRLKAWQMVQMFLDEKAIPMPRHLNRSHCADYMTWRKKPNKSKGKYRANHNTALYEIKLLALVMGEAVLRGYAPFNPCRDLDIKREDTSEAPELPQDVLTFIQVAIDMDRELPELHREFLRNSFLIARYHGTRITETRVNPVSDVTLDGERSSITFYTKGGNTHTVLLHPRLHKLFADMKANGLTESYGKLPNASRIWTQFLDRIGVRHRLPGACFKSFRVTVASELTRAGLSERLIMAYLGHASVTVSRAYVRWRAKDVSPAIEALD